MSDQKCNYWSVLSHLMTLSVVSLCIFEETCILLESPFHAELNGLCSNPTPHIEVSISYDCVIKYVNINCRRNVYKANVLLFLLSSLVT